MRPISPLPLITDTRKISLLPLTDDSIMPIPGKTSNKVDYLALIKDAVEYKKALS